jgi:hypothetical protein
LNILLKCRFCLLYLPCMTLEYFIITMVVATYDLGIFVHHHGCKYGWQNMFAYIICRYQK